MEGQLLSGSLHSPITHRLKEMERHHITRKAISLFAEVVTLI